MPDGLVCINRVLEVKAGFEATPAQAEGVVALMAGGVDAERLSAATGTGLDESRALLDLLSEHGILRVDEGPPGPPTGAALVDAIVSAMRGHPPTGVVWAGCEALMLPDALAPPIARSALRAFVAGLADHARLRAYGYAATTARRTVCGDAPDPERLEASVRAARRTDPAAIHVLDLEAGSRETISPQAFEQLGAERPHRLGPLLKLEPDPWQGPLGRRRHMWTAQHAVANLRYPETPVDRWGYGVGTSRDGGRLVASAETIERYAAGDIAGHTLVRSTVGDLIGAVPPTDQVRLSPRQYRERPEIDPYGPAEAYLWTPARAQDCSSRWVAAETVFFPFLDPERTTHLPPATSSGVAAHHDSSAARATAFRELVERDHFMWTWVQRISRERIDSRTLGPDAGDLVALVEAAGYEVALVNLTLDLYPVILAVAHAESVLKLGCSCHPNPERAAVKALEEAATSLDEDRLDRPESLVASEMRGPLDHERLYQRPERIAEAAFLFQSDETIRLPDVQRFSEPLEERLAQIGEPLTVDLSSPRTRPFRVVRAIVPGLVPISFGWDREPLGVPRLAEPKTTADDLTLGRHLDLAEAGPILPHPFS